MKRNKVAPVKSSRAAPVEANRVPSGCEIFAEEVCGLFEMNPPLFNVGEDSDSPTGIVRIIKQSLSDRDSILNSTNADLCYWAERARKAERLLLLQLQAGPVRPTGLMDSYTNCDTGSFRR